MEFIDYLSHGAVGNQKVIPTIIVITTMAITILIIY